MVKITIFQIKLVHTLIFWILSACVVYALFSGFANRIDIWTWVAVGLLLVESVVLGPGDEAILTLQDFNQPGQVQDEAIYLPAAQSPRGTMRDY